MEGFLEEEIFVYEPTEFFMPAAAGGGQLIRLGFVSWICGLNSVK
jgi:hypothetical protein